MALTLDQIVEAYVTTRELIKDLESKISELKAFQTKKEEYINQKLQELGVDNVKTKHGTAYSTVFESITVADPETFFNYVKDNDAWELMEKRAAKTAVLQVMGDREDSGRPNPPPAGLSYTAVRKINIRK